MKRILQIALLLSACLIFAASCTAPRKYASFVETTANDGTGISSEMSEWDGLYFQTDCPKELSRSILGETYYGTYRDSTYEKLDSYVTDIYECESGEEFGVRHDTGEPVYLNLMTADFFETEPLLDDVPDAEEAAIALAKETARQFLPDYDEYEMTVDEPKPYVNDKDGQEYRMTFYFINFIRIAAGYNSSDFMTVKVTSKGHLASLIVGDTGAFSGKELSIDKAKVDKSIEKKVEDVYAATPYELLSNKIDDQKLVVTKDGKAAVYSEVSVSISETSGNEWGSLVAIITFVD